MLKRSMIETSHQLIEWFRKRSIDLRMVFIGLEKPIIGTKRDTTMMNVDKEGNPYQ